MNTELLNAAAKFLFENGVELKNDEATRHAIISLCISTLTKAGVPADKAYDAVMGSGQFRKLSDSLWEGFQAVKA